jgi:hypothetical protein
MAFNAAMCCADCDAKILQSSAQYASVRVASVTLLTHRVFSEQFFVTVVHRNACC